MVDTLFNTRVQNAGGSIIYRKVPLGAPLANQRLYATANPMGAVPVVGATLSQAMSGATATVAAINVTSPGHNFDINTIVGIFDVTNLVTGTNPNASTFTFTPSMNPLSLWQLVVAPKTPIIVTDDALNSYLIFTENCVMSGSAQARLRTDVNQVENATYPSTIVVEYGG